MTSVRLLASALSLLALASPVLAGDRGAFGFGIRVDADGFLKPTVQAGTLSLVAAARKSIK